MRGKVLDANGKPVVGHEVKAQAADKRENRYYDPTTKTNERGEFELRFVRAGKQIIQAEPFWLVAEQGPASRGARWTPIRSVQWKGWCSCRLRASAGQMHCVRLLMSCVKKRRQPTRKVKRTMKVKVRTDQTQHQSVGRRGCDAVRPGVSGDALGL